MKRKVLILSAGFGHGHNTAAYALRDALEQIAPETEVEVLDLIKMVYGWRNNWVKKIFLLTVEHAPKIWEWLYLLLDRTSFLKRQMRGMGKLRAALHELLKTVEPDAVISTYPAYNYLMDEIYADHKERPFSKFTVITDSITVNSVWFASLSDAFFVANSATAQVMIEAGVPHGKIQSFGFPVSTKFYELAQNPIPRPDSEMGVRRLLYLIHTGKKNAGEIIERLLEIQNLHLTVSCGTHVDLKSKLTRRLARYKDRVRVIGWSNEMPEILSTCDMVITKAGGATTQEAIAAKCPLIVNQVIPGQEKGNAQLVEFLGIGAIAANDEEVIRLVQEISEPDSTRWKGWKEALEKHSRPDAALRIAEFVLEHCHEKDRPHMAPPLSEEPKRVNGNGHFDAPAVVSAKKPLLCDFHTHTHYSDGKLSVRELVDTYGTRGFDCLCITDHLAEKSRVIGKLANMSRLTLDWNDLEEYFEVIEKQKKRAWRKYNMVLMTGLEFNKDGLTKSSSTHLLGVDLQTPIHPDFDLTKLIAEIHSQGALAIASHPHLMKSAWSKNTLYLWDNQGAFGPLIDAWEIANRDEIFSPVGLKRLPFVANSDFHKPRHIESWKTVLHCEKHSEAIKQCVRENRDVSIMFYRDALASAMEQQRLPSPPSKIHRIPDEEPVLFPVGSASQPAI